MYRRTHCVVIGDPVGSTRPYVIGCSIVRSTRIGSFSIQLENLVNA